MPVDPDPFPWLPLASVLTWLKIDDADEDGRAETIDDCRMAAAEWIEEQRPDLVTTETVDDETIRIFNAGYRRLQAGKLATARLFARRDTPNGVVSFDELVAGSLLADDPDVKRLVGRARPRLG